MEIADNIVRRVEDKVIETYLLAQSLYGRVFDVPDIEWSLRGLTAGRAMFRGNRIRLNAIFLRDNTEDFIAQTIPHEIAHLLNNALHGFRVKPHGPEWKSIMRALGLSPIRCHDYDVTKAAFRRQKRHIYFCDCGVRSISQTIHNRVCRGWAYQCR